MPPSYSVRLEPLSRSFLVALEKETPSLHCSRPTWCTLPLVGCVRSHLEADSKAQVSAQGETGVP